MCSSCWQSIVAGGALKSTATQPTPGGWWSPNTGATNSSGFTAGPGARRMSDGRFDGVGGSGFWWSSSTYFFTGAWFRIMFHMPNPTNVNRTNGSRANGYSVRCLRD
jgi:uncharacterized protein (TIGR02145 family)